MEYHQYLHSDHWKRMRELKLSKFKCCEICDSDKHLNVHHGRYLIDTYTALKTKRISGSILGNEKPFELFVLCASCHRTWHAVFGKEYVNSKHIKRIRYLLSKGAKKSMAFYTAKNNDLYKEVHNATMKLEKYL